MEFQEKTTTLAMMLDVHVADRDIIIPFQQFSIRKWTPRGEPGAKWIAYLNGVKVAQGECVMPRQPSRTELFHENLALVVDRGAKLKFVFSKMPNQRDPSPAVTVSLECTAIFE